MQLPAAGVLPILSVRTDPCRGWLIGACKNSFVLQGRLLLSRLTALAQARTRQTPQEG